MKNSAKYLLAFICLILTAVCCSDKINVENPEEPAPSGIDQKAARNIVISTSVENQDGTSTKTALGTSNSVIWSEGDSFSLLSEKTSTGSTLVVTINAKSSGLGLKLSDSDYNKNYYVKYSGIEILDSSNSLITDLVSTSTSSNKYKIGIYNSINQYQYAPAGTVVAAYVESSNNTIPLVQSSSSSEATFPITVKLTGIEYSKDKTTWTAIDENTTLSNGTSWGKKDVSYKWESTAPSNSAFTLSAGGAGKTSASFTGTLENESATHYALYPYNSSNSISGSTLSFTIPATQEYVAGTFAGGANPMAGIVEGEGDNYHVSLRNLCGILKLNLIGNEIVTSIEITDKNGALLSGKASVDMSADEPTATISEGSSTITLECASPVQLDPTTPTAFYFVVPATAFKGGFTAKINTFYGTGTRSMSKDIGIARSKIISMAKCSVGKIEIDEFNIENPAVVDYTTNATVTLSSTGDSNYDQSFFDASRAYRPDQPNTKTVAFSNNDASEVTITMATDAAYSNTVLRTTTTGASYTLRNFVPGNTYYYKVTDGSSILTAGAFTATGQVRMISIDKGFNIRDLGGWVGLEGSTLKYCQIYRGGSLGGTDMYGTTSDITDDDRAELNRIGIRAQLDLRAATNSGKYSGEYSYHSYSRGETTLTNADFNNTMTDYGAYNGDASVVSDVAWIIYELKQGKPVYFNCRQGADRTGTVAFIIEGLLGCYGSNTGHQMAMDYELTGFSQANLVDNKTVDTSYRGATEAYGNSSKLFCALLNLSASGITFNNLQEKCYYYLNKYWSDTQIDKDDLDWFIKYMLDLDSYTHPTWAATGGKLKTVAEKNSNVVTYRD